MLHEKEWQPTKFVAHRSGWRASRDTDQVGLGSRLMADRIASAYAQALHRHARGKLLDVGCGHVPLYGCYKDLVDDVTCIDWPNTPHPSPHIDLYANLSQELPLADAQFDTILVTDVLEHLPYPDVLWGELARLLRPGGAVILGVPFMYWVHERPHDHHRYTEFRLRLFCEDHGLAVLECEPYGGALDVAADVMGKLFNRGAFRPLTRIIAWAASRRKTVEDHTPMPLGYVLIAQKQLTDESAG